MNPAAKTLEPVDLHALPEYFPTAYIDFSKPDNRQAFEKALETVRGQLGKEASIVSGGERLKGSGTFESRNPARPEEVIGRFQSGTKEQATRAIEVAAEAFLSWSRVHPAERAAYLLQAASRMLER